MSGTPLFSVIIPTHGRGQFLSRALGSVLEQTIADFECIVVDDASPTPVTVPADPRIRLIRREVNGGVSAARNTGLRAATGRYVTFLDDDDTYAPERLAIGVAGLEHGPLSTCWMAPLGVAPSRRQWKALRRHENRQLDGNVHDTIATEVRPHLGQVSMQRDLVPPFEESLSTLEDVEWWIQATRRSGVTCVRRIGYFQQWHKGVRLTDSLRTRLEDNRRLLDLHAEYFAEHPKAEAMRWRHIGRVLSLLGDRAGSRRAFARSMRLHPRINTMWYAMRTEAQSVVRGRKKAPPRR